MGRIQDVQEARVTVATSSIVICLWVLCAPAYAVQVTPEPSGESESEPPPFFQDLVEEEKNALLDHASERPVRLNAAIKLLGLDSTFLKTQLATNTSDDVALAILDALDIRAADQVESIELLPAVLALTVAAERPEVSAKAEQTLRTLDRTYPYQTRPMLVEALAGGDASLATASIRVMALTRELVSVEPLLGVLERTGGTGPLAEEAAAALAVTLGIDYGPDPVRWREFWRGCAGKSRDRILEEVLLAERESSTMLLEQKDREIVRLKKEVDAGNPEALVADLEYVLPAIRRFAAESLTRSTAEWDENRARAIVLKRLATGNEPPDVVAAFLNLIEVVDVRASRNGPDADRDAVIAKMVGSKDPTVVVAAVKAAEAFPMKQVRDAVLRVLLNLEEEPLTPEVRLALVKASDDGKLSLRGARGSLEQLLLDDDVVDVRVAAVTALGSLEMEETAPAMIRALREDIDWRVRRRAASALFNIAGSGAAEALTSALTDVKPEVRSEVAMAIATISSDAVVRALLERFDQEDVINVRTVLARALGEAGDPAALEALCVIASSAPPAPIEGNGVDPAEQAYREAVDEAIRAIAGDDPLLWQRIGELVAERGRGDLARTALERRLEILESGGSPVVEVWAAQRDLALVALREENFARALELVSVFPELLLEPLSPDSSGPLLLAELHAIKGQALAGQGKHADAAAALKEALVMGVFTGEQRASVALLAAEAYRAGGDVDGAIAVFDGVTTLTDTELRLLAGLERSAGRTDDAIQHFEELLSRHSGRNDENEYMTRLDLAQTLLDSGNVKAAAAALPPENIPVPDGVPEAARTRAAALMKRVADAALQDKVPVGATGAGNGA